MDDRDRIDAEASRWMVAVADGGLDGEGRRQFESWCHADPRHRPAYDTARSIWDEVAGLDHLAELAPLVPPARRTAVKSRFVPRRFAAGLAAAAAVVFALVSTPADIWHSAARYRTGLAETRIVALPDGSSVTLGAASSIKVSFAAGERRVVLTGGEAFFDVVHDRRRPFLVEAGTSVVRDIGTKFDVNMTASTVRVAVSEGMVAVSRKSSGGDAGRQMLKAGQLAEIAVATSNASPSVPQAIVPQPIQAPAAWREGRLVFDNVRLADLVEDVNRYYAPGVKLTDNIADIRVTASFKTSEIPGFMASFPNSFPVNVTSGGDGSFVVGARRR